MLTANIGLILDWEIHSDLDNHYNDDPVSLARERTLELYIAGHFQDGQHRLKAKSVLYIIAQYTDYPSLHKKTWLKAAKTFF